MLTPCFFFFLPFLHLHRAAGTVGAVAIGGHRTRPCLPVWPPGRPAPRRPGVAPAPIRSAPPRAGRRPGSPYRPAVRRRDASIAGLPAAQRGVRVVWSPVALSERPRSGSALAAGRGCRSVVTESRGTARVVAVAGEPGPRPGRDSARREAEHRRRRPSFRRRRRSPAAGDAGRADRRARSRGRAADRSATARRPSQRHGTSCDAERGVDSWTTTASHRCRRRLM